MTFQESKQLFTEIFQNKLNEFGVREVLLALTQKGETAEEIAGAMEAMKSFSIKVPVSPDLQDKLIDNCGTGGDKSGSFNISTTVSFVLAGAGLFVAKHGNRSITSKSGSADVLEYLGFNLDLTPEQHAKLIEESGFTFMFAQKHHPAMKHIMPIRKSIPHRTIFNILGPLTNPAEVKKQLIGVFHKDYISKIAEALKIGNSKSAIVVSSRDGLDEVSISDISDFAMLKDEKITYGEINPQDYGFKLYEPEEIKGGDVEQNGKILLSILKNELTGAKKDIVILNSAVAFLASGMARDLKDGIEIANQSLNSGKAFEHLQKSIKISKKL
jgi:anthranilate phosphoribosyltransferase